MLMRCHASRVAGSMFDVESSAGISDSDMLGIANERVARMYANADDGLPVSRMVPSVSSFSDESLSTSLYLLDIMTAAHPSAVDWKLVHEGVALSAEEKMENAKYAISVAHKLGCAVPASWQDIVEVNDTNIMMLVAAVITSDKWLGRWGRKTALPGLESEEKSTSFAESAKKSPSSKLVFKKLPTPQMVGASNIDEWYYMLKGKGSQMGPITVIELARLLAAGTVTKETLVSHSGIWSPWVNWNAMGWGATAARRATMMAHKRRATVRLPPGLTLDLAALDELESKSTPTGTDSGDVLETKSTETQTSSTSPLGSLIPIVEETKASSVTAAGATNGESDGGALPSPWVRLHGKRGVEYYHNASTGETSWSFPVAHAAEPCPTTGRKRPAMRRGLSRRLCDSSTTASAGGGAAGDGAIAGAARINHHELADIVHGSRRVSVRWNEALDPLTGRTYYVDNVTEAKSWNVPTAVKLAQGKEGRMGAWKRTGTGGKRLEADAYLAHLTQTFPLVMRAQQERHGDSVFSLTKAVDSGTRHLGVGRAAVGGNRDPLKAGDEIKVGEGREEETCTVASVSSGGRGTVTLTKDLLNHHDKKAHVRRIVSMIVADSESETKLYRALQDGSTYCALLNAIEEDAVDLRALEFDIGASGEGYDVKARTHNMEMCLATARDMYCDVTAFGSHDLMDYEGNPEGILDFTHRLIRRQLLSPVSMNEEAPSGSAGSVEAVSKSSFRRPKDLALLGWTESHLRQAGYQFGYAGAPAEISWDGNVWNDGKVVCALVQHLFPNAKGIPLYGSRADKLWSWALSTAKGAGVRVFLQPAFFMGRARAVELSNYSTTTGRLAMLFVAQLYVAAGFGERQKKRRMNRSAAFAASELQVDRHHDEAALAWLETIGCHGNFRDVATGYILLHAIDRVAPGSVQWGEAKQLSPTEIRGVALNLASQSLLIAMTPASLSTPPPAGATRDAIVHWTFAIVRLLMRCHASRVAAVMFEVGDVSGISDHQLLALANARVTTMYETGGGGDHFHKMSSRGRAKMYAAHGGHAAELPAHRKGPSVMSFGESTLSDSLYLLDVMTAADPSVVDWTLVHEGESLSASEKVANAKYAISVAHKLGCAVPASWQDIVEVNDTNIMLLVAAVMTGDKWLGRWGRRGNVDDDGDAHLVPPSKAMNRRLKAAASRRSLNSSEPRSRTKTKMLMTLSGQCGAITSAEEADEDNVDEWFYMIGTSHAGGSRRGPVTVHRLEQLISRGTIRLESLVSHAGVWSPWSNWEEMGWGTHRGEDEEGTSQPMPCASRALGLGVLHEEKGEEEEDDDDELEEQEQEGVDDVDDVDDVNDVDNVLAELTSGGQQFLVREMQV